MRVSSAEWLLLSIAFFLFGCARGPSLHPAPGTPQVQQVLDFGLVPVGAAVSMPLPLSDVGSGPLDVIGVTLAGDPSFSAPFSSATIQAGQDLTLVVHFAPQAPGRKTGTMTFAVDSTAEGSALVELIGTAYDNPAPDGSLPGLDAGPDAGGPPPADAGLPEIDAGPPDAGTTFYEPSAWPKWHRDNANTGRSGADTTNNVGQVRFKIPIGVPVSPFQDLSATYLMSPVVGFDPDSGNDVIYQLGYGQNGVEGPASFIAVDGPSGQTLWSADVTIPEPLAQEGTPTLVVDRSIYLETGGEQRGQNQAYHFDARGNVLSATTNVEPDGSAGDGYDTCPGFSNDGTLYLFEDDWPMLASFATASGALVPRFIASAPSIAHVESFSAALTDSNQSVFSWGGMVLSFDGNGVPLWGGPVILGGGNMVAGWERDNGTACENNAKGAPVILGGDAVVAYAGYDVSCSEVVGGLTALDLGSGAPSWSFDFPPQPPPADPRYVDAFLGSLIVGYSSPALLHDGGLVFGYLDGVYCFDPPAAGQNAPSERWRYSTGLVLSSPAVSADDTVFVGSSDGNMYALDGHSGQPRFVVSVGSAVNSSPAIGSDGTVYFSADDGNLWAVR
jgi:outer membrane protein assembly factor BamB